MYIIASVFHHYLT